MKKLMVMIGAVATALGLFADTLAVPNGTSFETLTAGVQTKEALDTADEAMSATWTIPAGADTVTATAWTAEEKAAYTAGRPTQFNDGGTAQTQYLAVKSAFTNGAARTIGGDGVGFGTAGLYVDTLVKFTGADEDIELPAGANAKISVWTKDYISDANEVTNTTLMVTADKYVAGTAQGATIYNLGTLANPTDWHRLTIKAVNGDAKGFVVFIDKNVRFSTAAQTAFDGIRLNESAQAFADAGQLFPSLVDFDGLKTVAIAGQGAIDDISFTQDVPFPGAGDKEFFSISAGEHVVTTGLKVNGNNYTAGTLLELTSNPMTFEVTGDAYDNGWLAGTWTATTGASVEGKTFTVTAGGATGTIVAQEAYVTITCMVGETPTTVSAVSITDALAKIPDGATGVKFTLTKAVTESERISINKAITLDLNGQVLTGAINASANLVITNAGDEVENEGVLYKGRIVGDVMMDAQAHKLDIYGGYINGSVSYSDESESGLATVYGGQFTNDPTDEYDYYLHIANNTLKSVKLAEMNVWQVSPKATYAITIGTLTGVTLTVDGNAATDFTALEGQSYAIVATPTSGYKTPVTISFNSTDITSSAAAYVFTAAGTLTASATVQGTMFYIGDTGYGSWAEAIAAADAGATIKVGTSAVIPADQTLAKQITIDLNGNTLMIAPTATIVANVTFAAAGGTLVAAGDMNVNATLDLGNLAYSQVPQEGGQFVLGATGKVIFPAGVTGLPTGAVAGAIKSAADGAEIKTDAWYTKNQSVWVAGQAATAVAKIDGGMGYETFAAAAAAAVDGDEIVVLSNLTGDNKLSAFRTAAAVINLGGREVEFKADQPVTFTGTVDVVVKNGAIDSRSDKDLIFAADKKSIFVTNIVSYAVIRPTSTVRIEVAGCTFYCTRNLVDGSNKALDEYTPEEQVRISDIFKSWDLHFTEGCPTYVHDNTLYQSGRCCLWLAAAGADFYVYNNLFIGDKNRHSSGDWEKYFPAMQLYAAKSLMYENNTFRNVNPVAGKEQLDSAFAFYLNSSMPSDAVVVFRGNTIESTVPSVWSVYRSGSSDFPPATKVLFGENTFWEGIKSMEGKYKTTYDTMGITTNVNLKLPAGVATCHEWVAGDKLLVNGAAAASLAGVKVGDVVLAYPTQSVATLDTEKFSMAANAPYANEWTIGEKVTAIQLAVSTSSANITELMYAIDGGEAKAVTADPIAVNAGSTIVFTPTLADGYYATVSSFNGNISNPSGFTFTVNDQLSSAEASVVFGAELAQAKTSGGVLLKNFAELWNAATNTTTEDYVILLQDCCRNSASWPYKAGAVARLNPNGFKFQIKEDSVASMESVTNAAGAYIYTKLTYYASVAAAWAANRATATTQYMLATNLVESATPVVTLNAGEVFAGTFGLDNTGITYWGSIEGGVAAAAGCELVTNTLTAAAFSFTATSLAPIPPPAPGETVEDALKKAGVAADDPVLQTVTTQEELTRLNAIILVNGGFSSDPTTKAAQLANLNDTYLLQNITDGLLLEDAAVLNVESIDETETAGTYEFKVTIKAGSNSIVAVKEACVQAIKDLVQVASTLEGTDPFGPVDASKISGVTLTDGVASFTVNYGDGAKGFMKLKAKKPDLK